MGSTQTHEGAATAEMPALTEEDELYWRIYAPKTHRLDVGVTWGDGRVDSYAPYAPYSPYAPRLWLMEMSDGYGPDEDMLWIRVDALEPWHALCRAAREAVYFAEGFVRCGTWRRYFQDLAYAKHIIAGTGWTLTAEERALMDSLETKAAECPAWVRERMAQS